VKIFWTLYAETKILEIEDYYIKVSNESIATKLIHGIFDTVEYLIDQPKIRPIEEMLVGRKEKFRYVVYKNYKIIYWINEAENHIEIMNVFDCRQDEQKLLVMD